MKHSAALFNSLKQEYFFPIKILKTHQMQRLIIGDLMDQDEENVSKAILKLYVPFVEIIINTFQSTTRDIREISRLARLLWPKYIDPLEKGDITRSKPDTVSESDIPKKSRTVIKTWDASGYVLCGDANTTTISTPNVSNK